jgi:hypothetical protein
VSSVSYYLLWLGVGLLIAALASAAVVRRQRWYELRRTKAALLLDALARHTEWVSTQGHAVLFQADVEGTDGALQEIGYTQEQWFPELRREAQTLFELHIRLVRYLRSQYRQQLQDPDAWFESDQDAGFMALWREHCATVAIMEQRLTLLANAGTSARQAASA